VAEGGRLPQIVCECDASSKFQEFVFRRHGVSYELTFTSTLPTENKKDVGKNVFLADLKADYKVFAFYYPGAMPDRNLENKLKTLGESSGKNLFVNVGRLNDPQFDKVTRQFGITKYPVIVLTAIESLASPAQGDLTAYARLDGKHLLSSAEETLKCVEKVFTLFLQGDVKAAIACAKWTQRAELLAWIGGWFMNALKALGKFVADRDISFSLAEGRLELKKSGE